MSDSDGNWSPFDLANSDAPEDTKRLLFMSTLIMVREEMIHTAGEYDPGDQACVNTEGFHARV